MDRFGAAVMDGVGGHEADAGVAVLVVVPGEELAAERSGVLDRVEAGGEAGPVLQRLELRLGVGVVGRGVRAVVGLEHAEVGEQERDGLAGHRAAAVGVHRQLIGRDVLLLADLGDEVLGDERVLAVLDGPADGVAAEDVEDHVEVEVRPGRRALELGDVPRVHLVGLLGEQLGRRVGRMGELRAALAHLAVLAGEQPVHRAFRGQVAALVKQRRPHLRGRAVDEALGVQLGEDGLALGLRQRPRRRRRGPRGSRRGRPATAVDRRRRRAQRATCRPGSDDRGEVFDGLLDHRSVLPCAPLGSSKSPSSAETFPCTSITLRAFSSSRSARSKRRWQRGDLRLARIGLRTPAGTIERRKRAALALAAPLRQQRRVQALAAQQRTDLTRLAARVGLAQDPQLVLRGEAASTSPLDELGIRRGHPATSCARSISLRSPTARSREPISVPSFVFSGIPPDSSSRPQTQ